MTASLALGAISFPTRRSFRIVYPSGMRVLHTIANDYQTFATLDRIFLRSAHEELSGFQYTEILQLFRLSSVPREDAFEYLVGMGTVMAASLFHVGPILVRYLLWAARGDPQKVPAPLATLASAKAYLDLVRELSQATIEDVPIRTGIAWFSTKQELRQWAIGSTRFDTPIEQVSFATLKRILPLASKDDLFIALVGDQASGVIRLPRVSIGIGRVPTTSRPRPLIARIDGPGNIDIMALDPGPTASAVLSFRNGAPRVRDPAAVREALSSLLLARLQKASRKQVRALVNCAIELSMLRKGSIFVVSDQASSLVSSIRVRTSAVETSANRGDLRAAQHFLAHALTDGAVCMTSTMRLTHFGAILPVAPATLPTLGGARHTSAAAYTQVVPGSLAIVVSQDGPISVFESGKGIFHA